MLSRHHSDAGWLISGTGKSVTEGLDLQIRNSAEGSLPSAKGLTCFPLNLKQEDQHCLFSTKAPGKKGMKIFGVTVVARMSYGHRSSMVGRENIFE